MNFFTIYLLADMTQNYTVFFAKLMVIDSGGVL